jgi:hypothetical protein
MENKYFHETLTKEQKSKIQENTIQDSGVICMESWHSKDGDLVVTNINLNKQPGFYADRIYTLKNKGEHILTSKVHGEIVDEYSKLMINKLSI